MRPRNVQTPRVPGVGPRHPQRSELLGYCQSSTQDFFRSSILRCHGPAPTPAPVEVPEKPRLVHAKLNRIPADIGRINRLE